MVKIWDWLIEWSRSCRCISGQAQHIPSAHDHKYTVNVGVAICVHGSLPARLHLGRAGQSWRRAQQHDAASQPHAASALMDSSGIRLTVHGADETAQSHRVLICLAYHENLATRAKPVAPSQALIAPTSTNECDERSHPGALSKSVGTKTSQPASLKLVVRVGHQVCFAQLSCTTNISSGYAANKAGLQHPGSAQKGISPPCAMHASSFQNCMY